MKKLLITGFEPFGGESVNPSWQAVEMLPEFVEEYCLTKLCLPVVFGDAAIKVISKAEEIKPDVILCIGQAGGREAITPEMIGINLRHSSIPDNEGNNPNDEKICEYGNDGYFSTIPVRKIAESINNEGIKSQVSYSAGAYVCNDTLYTLLQHFNGSNVLVGFIHIPYSSEQVKDKRDAPSMSLEKICKALKIAIKNL